MFRPGSAAIVTGAGPGMGRAVAVGLARHGVDVTISSRRQDRLESVADAVRAVGREPLVVPGDLTDPESCRAVVDATVARFGRLDILVQNGHHEGDWSPVVDADADRWRDVFEVNFFGALHLVQHAVRAMTTGDPASIGGAIVLVNSGAALRNPPTMGAYAASKAALASLVRTAALEVGPAVRVNGVFLGPVTGENTDRSSVPLAEAAGISVEEHIRRKGAGLPLGAIPTPEQCAGSVLFLASELAAPVTGQHLSVNGGQWVT